MLIKITDQLQIVGSWKWRITLFSLTLTLAAIITVIAQDDNYWANATISKNKIFAISFTNEQNGRAISAEGDVLATSDGGRNWILDNKVTFVSEKTSPQILWNAEIYCAIMKTTDGGNSWIPYDEDKQEHFCGVYLKDTNTGYKVASEFLNKVISEISYHNENNNLDSLADHPRKCTEYFRNAEEGWALGWCVRNFSQNKNR